LKNAVVAFFNARQVRSTARKTDDFHRRFWHRIHAMTQPVEFFNRLLSRVGQTFLSAATGSLPQC
jgi:hypothetical protein